MTEGPVPRPRRQDTRQPGPAGREIVVVVDGSLGPAQVAVLCEHVALRLADPAVERVACDAAAIDRPDLQAIDALARLALAARRSGASVQVRQAGTDLRAWLAFVGLAEILPCDPAPAPRDAGVRPGRSVLESSG